MTFLRRTERLLLVVGSVLVTIFLTGYASREILLRTELTQFHDLHSKKADERSTVSLPEARFKLDFSLWSEKRIADYQRSLAQYIDPPMAVLRIPKVHLEVPVLEGTDELVLNRGVGHIAGTAFPGEQGNTGIAGHRDGFFRALKDVGPGDTIELLTPEHRDTYVVDQVVLVDPSDVSVLQPRSVSSLTLVTCYPFYYVGSAPQRYIVHASLTDPDWAVLPTGKQVHFKPRYAEPEPSTR